MQNWQKADLKGFVCHIGNVLGIEMHMSSFWIGSRDLTMDNHMMRRLSRGCNKLYHDDKSFG